LPARLNGHRARADPTATEGLSARTGRLDMALVNDLTAGAASAGAGLTVVREVRTGVSRNVSGPRHHLYPRSPLPLSPMIRASIPSLARFA